MRTAARISRSSLTVLCLLWTGVALCGWPGQATPHASSSAFARPVPIAEPVATGAEPFAVAAGTANPDGEAAPLAGSREPQRAWITLGHAVQLLSAVTGLTLAVVLWVVILRQRVKQQTRAIRESEARFRDLAQHDALTGLPNRFMLEERIEPCLSRSSSAGQLVAVLTIDIDRFKHINDTYGHPAADACLQALVARIKGQICSTDMLARTGGEEFTLVAGGLPDRESAVRVATGVLDLFREPLVVAGREMKVTVSIGGAIYPEDGSGAEVLRQRSDQALYQAKRRGRNRAVFATQEMAASHELTVRMEKVLRESLRAGSFLLVYQPICDQTGAIRRLEALVRAKDAQLAAYGQSRFVSMAEECGLMVPLGRWVLTEVCRQIAEWRAAGLNPCPINVNISGRQLLHRNFAGELAAILARYQVQPEMLELELTETAVMTEAAALADMVDELAEAGHSFAIDDFGTGYSSLSRLRELPIRTLKIDRSFVTDLKRSSDSYTIIQAVTQMARSLGLELVAEGVETVSQFEILLELKCGLFQGFLFARPMSGDAAAAAFEQRLLEASTPGGTR